MGEISPVLCGSTQPLELQHPARVFAEDFALGFFVGGEFADGGELLGAGASGALADGIGAVAAVEELVLVAGEEGAGVVFIADEGAVAGAGGEIGEHVGVIGEQAVGNAAGDHGARGVEDFLVVVFGDVAPEGLRVADEVYPREFLQDAVEAVDVVVVGALLEMHEHRHVEFAGEGGEFLDAGGVTGDVELLFTDADGAGLELAADDLDGVGLVGDLVGEPGETIGMFFGEGLRLGIRIHAGFKAEAGAGG